MIDIRRYLDTYCDVLRSLDHATVVEIAREVWTTWDAHHTVFLCGNGGSAASASHLATDLVKLTTPPTGARRLRAMALGESLSAVSAISNDLAYDQIFVEQLRAFLSPGDLVIGLSTSGASPNVLCAVEFAASAGARTVGITGASGSPLQARVRVGLVVPSLSVQHVEDATMVAGHLICLMVRDYIASAGRSDVTVPAIRQPA